MIDRTSRLQDQQRHLPPIERRVVFGTTVYSIQGPLRVVYSPSHATGPPTSPVVRNRPRTVRQHGTTTLWGPLYSCKLGGFHGPGRKRLARSTAYLENRVFANG